MKVPGGREAALCAGAAVVLAIAGRLVVPSAICDDAYITMKTAQNLAAGAGLSFNRGEMFYVSTTPLWALLIAMVRVTGIDTVTATQILGGGAEALLALGMTRLGTIVLGRPLAGSMAAAWVITNPAFLLTSHSGMEAPLALAVVAWSLSYAAERRWWPALVIASSAIWVRFDACSLVVVLGALAILDLREKALPLLLAPAVLVGAYFAFGALTFGDPIPISVQRKFGAESFLSRAWFEGAGLVAGNFALVAGGLSLSWYRFVTPLLLAPLVVAWGAWTCIRDRRTTMVSPGLFAFIYIAAYVASGRAYATYFPWYFLPPLVPFALASTHALKRFLHPATVAVWTVVMLVCCRLAARPLADVVSQREGRYAVAARSLSRVLPQGATIAANEIGTVGFFARDDLKVLDLFGLLRAKEERNTNAMELMGRHRPEAVVTRHRFDYRDHIDQVMPNAYRWIDTGDLLVGLRADLGDVPLVLDPP
jgi:hypothetical protein